MAPRRSTTLRPGQATPDGPAPEERPPELSEAELAELRRKLIVTVAAGAHEVHRAYLSTLGSHIEPSWGACGHNARQSFLAGIERIVVGGLEDPAELHAAWVEYRQHRGWKRGPLDERAKTHPFLCPWEELPSWQQAKSMIIVTAAVGIMDALAIQEFEPAQKARTPSPPKLQAMIAQQQTAQRERLRSTKRRFKV